MEEQAIEQAARDAYASYANDPVKKHLFIPKVSAYVTGVKSQKAKEFHTKGMYSEEEVYHMFQKYGRDRLEEELRILGGAMESFEVFTIDEWFEQNKKK